MHRHVSADSGFRSARRRRRYAPEKKKTQRPACALGPQGSDVFWASRRAAGVGVGVGGGQRAASGLVRGGTICNRRRCSRRGVWPPPESRSGIPTARVGGRVDRWAGRRKEEGGRREQGGRFPPNGQLLFTCAGGFVGGMVGVQRCGGVPRNRKNTDQSTCLYPTFIPT